MTHPKNENRMKQTNVAQPEEWELDTQKTIKRDSCLIFKHGHTSIFGGLLFYRSIQSNLYIRDINVSNIFSFINYKI